jgi:hypothetical protein
MQFTTGFDGDLVAAGRLTCSAPTEATLTISACSMAGCRTGFRIGRRRTGRTARNALGATARANGCLPRLTPRPDHRRSEGDRLQQLQRSLSQDSTLVNAGASITGTLLTLPAGPVRPPPHRISPRYRAHLPSAQVQAGNSFYPQESPVMASW